MVLPSIRSQVSCADKRTAQRSHKEQGPQVCDLLRSHTALMTCARRHLLEENLLWLMWSEVGR